MGRSVGLVGPVGCARWALALLLRWCTASLLPAKQRLACFACFVC